MENFSRLPPDIEIYYTHFDFMKTFLHRKVAFLENGWVPIPQ